jgi:2-succinyl-5-enolpyruvyl-6-hydroxy-3-cyclohexene-1-carboxylate synthase
VVSEFHHVSRGHLHRRRTGAISPPSTSDPEWLPIVAVHDVAAQVAIERGALGLELSEPSWPGSCSAMPLGKVEGAAIMVSASMPMRDLEWFAPALPPPRRVGQQRGQWDRRGGLDRLGIAASGRRTFALLGDLAFLHDVSGLVNLPDVPCTLSCWTTGEGGSSRSCRRRPRSIRQFELLFGTPPTSDVGDVARGFGFSVCEVTAVPEFEALAPLMPLHLRSSG